MFLTNYYAFCKIFLLNNQLSFNSVQISVLNQHSSSNLFINHSSNDNQDRESQIDGEKRANRNFCEGRVN